MKIITKLAVSFVFILAMSLHSYQIKAQGNSKIPAKNPKGNIHHLQLDQTQVSSSTPVIDRKLITTKQIQSDRSKDRSSSRNCTPIKRSNPYSISRKDFDSLPYDRKQFILDHPQKYTITE